MAAYYNEFDKYAAQWLRNLIAAGLIAPGDVDERSIEDVSPDDLRGYTQHHFFAGIGVWSYALRRAGWPDDRPVWTGSCPCQPFSSAGAQAGFADERHLWPAFYHLIQELRPPVVFGEQVASKAAEPWIDLVQADLEALEYAFGCIAFPSAGVGAPHIRDRAYWVGHTNEPRSQGYAGNGGAARRERPSGSAAPTGVLGGVADADSNRHSERQPGGSREEKKVSGVHREEESCARKSGRTGDPVRGLADADLLGFQQVAVAELYDEGFDAEPRGSAGRLADPASTGRERWRTGEASDGRNAAWIESERLCETGREPPTGPTNGFWGTVDWLFCRDGKWRPVEPGTFPLVDGAPARVGRLRAYGNAINAEAATEFICAFLEAQDELLGRGLDLI